MPSKFTLALVACVAYGAASVMALPAQGAYDLSERDLADFTELETRMFDNGFEDFVARQVAVPPAAETPAAAASVAEPIPPAGANTLAATGAPESTPRPHPHHRHGGRRRHHHRGAQHRRRRHRHSHSHPGAGAGAGAKEAAVSTPGTAVPNTPDASTPAPAQDPSAPAPATPVAARSAPDAIDARDLPAHGAGTRRVPRTPSEILNDRTLDPDQRRHEILAAKRYREAVAHREALQAAGQGRR